MYIDISTPELKEQVYKLFDSFTKIGDIYDYYNVSDSMVNIKYVRKIAASIGFDLGIYKMRRQKFCILCGKVLTNYQRKFCSYSCAATYNNQQRGKRSESTKNKIRQSLLTFYGVEHKQESCDVVDAPRDVKKCIICGSPIKHNRVTCCDKCLEIHLRESNKNKRAEKYKYYLDHQEEFCRPNYTPKFKNEFIQEQNGVCAICGCKPEWNGNPLVFILDHIDGDASNNMRSNLRCICPNCDSQLDTYKSKNKNSTRRKYWKEKILRDALKQNNI